MLKISFTWIVFYLLFSDFTFASENIITNSDQNVSVIKEDLEKKSLDTEDDSEVTRKIKDFFGGILDDANEFAVDNKIIEKK